MTRTYTLFPLAEKVDLQAILGYEVTLQSTLRFAGFRPEELHYEDAPIREVNAVGGDGSAGRTSDPLPVSRSGTPGNARP